MKVLTILSLLISEVLFLRMFFLHLGYGNQNQSKKSLKGIKITVFILMILIFFSNKKVFLLFLGQIAFLFLIFGRLFLKIKPQFRDREFVDEVILSMKTGLSFNASTKDWAKPSEISPALYKVIQFCEGNPTLSFRVMESFRENLKFQIKLKSKQKQVTLQAKAQAFTCICLYGFIFAIQMSLNTDFFLLFNNSIGKMIFILGLLGMIIGVSCVFRMSEYSEPEV